jgi:hypothetical protein
MYRERNRIERMIGHLKINRAIATRYDKLAGSFLDALHIAAILRCVRYAQGLGATPCGARRFAAGARRLQTSDTIELTRAYQS